MTDGSPDIQPLGDSAFLIRLGGEADGDARAQALAGALANAAPPGLHDVAVAYDTVAVYFDPLASTSDALVNIALRQLTTARVPPLAASELHTIRVIYDGPDLDYVADQTGLSRAQIIELHSGAEYRARAVGFVPGFAYLGDLDERLRLPRRSTPRTRVPAGSVAIAGTHTAVYPFVTPGGWHLVGRTELAMFDPGREPAALLRVGARVRFVPA